MTDKISLPRYLLVATAKRVAGDMLLSRGETGWIFDADGEVIDSSEFQDASQLCIKLTAARCLNFDPMSTEDQPEERREIQVLMSLSGGLDVIMEKRK